MQQEKNKYSEKSNEILSRLKVVEHNYYCQKWIEED
jgi:hypothetical protein